MSFFLLISGDLSNWKICLPKEKCSVWGSFGAQNYWVLWIILQNQAFLLSSIQDRLVMVLIPKRKETRISQVVKRGIFCYIGQTLECVLLPLFGFLLEDFFHGNSLEIARFDVAFGGGLGCPFYFLGHLDGLVSLPFTFFFYYF